MFVIEVIPLGRGIHVESLSYFSSVPYDTGTILTITVRNRDIHGMVTSANPVSGAKAALRAATFSLKKLPVQEHTRTLSPAFVDTAYELADYYACQPGAALYQLLPPEVREGSEDVPHTPAPQPTETHAPEVLQGTLEERYRAYTSLVRQSLARGQSLLFVVPSPVEADTAIRQLGAGIEGRLVVFSSALTPKARRDAYQKLTDLSKPKLIIAVPAYAVTDRHDIGTVIVESERSDNYKGRSRPYFDHRVVLRTHTKKTGRRLIFGDLLVRTEEEAPRREEVYATYEETPKRVALQGKLALLTLKDKPEDNSPFRLFSEKVVEEIRRVRSAKGRAFLFAARRGLAPAVACVDCGYIFRSPESGAPYSLVRTTREGAERRWFVCGVSGKRERAADVCPSCGSWRLRERGIGIQHVYDELVKELPDVPIITFDHTTANTYKKTSFLRKKFYETKGAVMLGTQMALPHLTLPVDMSVVVSMDALRATPTWHREEAMLAMILHLREHTSGTVYVQTRKEAVDEPDHLIEYAKRGLLEKFYDEEIELRRTFKYPPFSHFIHLTWQGKPDQLTQQKEAVESTLKDFDVYMYSAPPSQSETRIMYGLIRVTSGEWPKLPLVAALRRLPPSVRIVMNPDRIV